MEKYHTISNAMKKPWQYGRNVYDGTGFYDHSAVVRADIVFT